MQALIDSPREALGRSARIVSLAELNRTRSLRALLRDEGPPGEVHPWAYRFPRPPVSR